MTDFRPLPLLGNRHVQTFLGTYLKGPPFAAPSDERHVALDDGDGLALFDSAPVGWRPGGGVVLLLHGLGGSHQSVHVQRLGNLLYAAGFRVVRMDLRGIGKGMALARRAYHGGLSDDVRAAAAAVESWWPGSPLTLVGFSVGGNVVLKLAGEAAGRPVPNLRRVVALAPPVDLAECVRLLSLPRNRLYERHFLYFLVRQVRQRERLFPDLRPVAFPRRLSLKTFDDLYTAPNWGFDGAADYYRRASALPLLPRIDVPTLILAARDDPFVCPKPLEQLTAPKVEVRVTDRGGHLGFLGNDGAGGFRWAERRVADWIARP